MERNCPLGVRKSLRNEAMTTYEHAVQKGKIEGNKEKENLVITNAYSTRALIICLYR